MSHVVVEKKSYEILDVGCGGGRLSASSRHAALEGTVYGIDLTAGMVRLSADEHRHSFMNAGYPDVQVLERRDKTWICAMGRKSA